MEKKIGSLYKNKEKEQKGEGNEDREDAGKEEGIMEMLEIRR